MIDWWQKRTPESKELEEASDHLGNAAFGAQTELLTILPQKVVQAFITHSKLVLKSQLLIIEKRQKANIFSHLSQSWDKSMPQLFLCLATTWTVFNQAASEEFHFNSFCLFLAVILAFPGKQTVFCAGNVSWIAMDFHRSSLRHFNFICKLEIQMQDALV